MIDDLTIRIDKLWISSLRGFDSRDIQFNGIGRMRRDTTRPLEEFHHDTDRRIYTIVSAGKEVDLDCELMNGWAGGGYSNTFHGYDSKVYSAFTDGCLGKDAPKDPMELSFRQARELYGDIGVLRAYADIKEAYDLGVKAAQTWPKFLAPIPKSS